MSNVIKLAERANNSAMYSVRDMIDSALDELDKEDSLLSNSNKAILIFLDDMDGGYEPGCIVAGMMLDQVISLLEVMKQNCVDELRGVDRLIEESE